MKASDKKEPVLEFDTEDLILELDKKSFELSNSDKIDILRIILFPHEGGGILTYEDENKLIKILKDFMVY